MRTGRARARLASYPLNIRTQQGVDLKRRPPKSRPTVSALKPTCEQAIPARTRPAGTPPSTFLFLPIHLSNSPGPKPRSRPPSIGEPSKPPPPIESEAWSPVSVRSFEARHRAEAGGEPNGQLYRVCDPAKVNTREGAKQGARIDRLRCMHATPRFSSDFGSLGPI